MQKIHGKRKSKVDNSIKELRQQIWDDIHNMSNENLIASLIIYAEHMKEECPKVGIANMNRDIEEARKIIDKLWINHLVSRG